MLKDKGGKKRFALVVYLGVAFKIMEWTLKILWTLINI